MQSDQIAVFPVSYFGSINYYKKLLSSDQVVFEKFEHYPKQTCRNRCYIQGANGKLMLTVPIKKGRTEHTLIKDVRISNEVAWQKLHWRSLEAAYRSSPYFEYLEDEFRVFFSKAYDFLFDLDTEIFHCLCSTLAIQISSENTEEYQKEYMNDLRNFDFFTNGPEDVYSQVFDTKQSFISNLSILDLLFNEGPKITLKYLQK
jgi:hypothetical protein